MKSDSLRRVGVCAAPVLALAVVLVSCGDQGTVEPNDDEWAQQTFVTMQVRHDLRLFVDGKEDRRVVSRMTRIPIVRGLDHASKALRTDLKASDGSRVRVRHHRDKNGKLLSIATVFEGDERLPRKFYAFENGLIKWIVTPAYRRHGGGHYRERSIMTWFDSTGALSGQITTGGGEVASAWTPQFASGITIPKAVVDALAQLLPKPLQAEELEGGCVTEWAIYALAGGVVATLATALTAAAVGCLRALPGACALMESTSLKLAAALAALNEALDRLVSCQLRDFMGPGADDGGGGNDMSDSGGESTGGGIDDVRRAVDEFIDDATERGSYYCTEDGDYCVYT